MDKVQKIKEEIERQIEFGKTKCQQSQENNDQESYIAWSEHIATCGKLLLFIDSLPKENNKDLEEEMKTWIPSHIEGGDECLRAVSIQWSEIVARHFANWQREQMMKDAVEAEVVDGYKYIPHVALIVKKSAIGQLKTSDKVKIIIVKED